MLAALWEHQVVHDRRRHALCVSFHSAKVHWSVTEEKRRPIFFLAFQYPRIGGWQNRNKIIFHVTFPIKTLAPLFCRKIINFRRLKVHCTTVLTFCRNYDQKNSFHNKPKRWGTIFFNNTRSWTEALSKCVAQVLRTLQFFLNWSNALQWHGARAMLWRKHSRIYENKHKLCRGPVTLHRENLETCKAITPALGTYLALGALEVLSWPALIKRFNVS